MKYGNIIDDHEIRSKDSEWVRNFLRNHGTGTNNYGRQFLGKIIAEYDHPTVLDAACGSAVNYETWRGMHIPCRYTGLDSTQGLLDEAARRYGDEITLTKGFVQELPFKDNAFDIVILRHILEHLADGYEKAVEEALRVASKEVIVVFFLDLLEGSVDKIEERSSGLVSNPEITHHWNTYSAFKFIKFLNVAERKSTIHHIATPGAAHRDTIFRIK